MPPKNSKNRHKTTNQSSKQAWDKDFRNCIIIFTIDKVRVEKRSATDIIKKSSSESARNKALGSMYIRKGQTRIRITKGNRKQKRRRFGLGKRQITEKRGISSFFGRHPIYKTGLKLEHRGKLSFIRGGNIA